MARNINTARKAKAAQETADRAEAERIAQEIARVAAETAKAAQGATDKPEAPASEPSPHSLFIAALETMGEADAVRGGLLRKLADFIPGELKGMSEEARKVANRDWDSRIIVARVRAVLRSDYDASAEEAAAVTYEAFRPIRDTNAKAWGKEALAKKMLPERLGNVAQELLDKAFANARNILSQARKLVAVTHEDGTVTMGIKADGTPVEPAKARDAKQGSNEADKAPQGGNTVDVEALLAALDPRVIAEALSRRKPIELAFIVADSTDALMASGGQSAHVTGGLDSAELDALQTIMGGALQLAAYIKAREAKKAGKAAEAAAEQAANVPAIIEGSKAA